MTAVIATLHGPSAHRAGVRTGRAEKARAMAGQEIDRLSDPSATEEERQAASGGFSRGPKSSKMFAAKGVKKDGDEHAANSL